MRISVVMCTCNGEKYIENQLISIVEQSYIPDEIIICDDKSDDHTISIVRQIAFRYSDIRWYIHINENRLGVRKNFQQAILYSTGDYVALADQDDIWEKNKIECLLFYLLEGYGLVHSDATLIDSFGNNFHASLTNYGSKLITQSFAGYLKGHNNVTGCTCMFKGDMRKKLYDFPSHYFYHDAWLALLAYKEGGIAYCDKKLLQYRLHESNVVGINKNRSNHKVSFRGLYFKSKDYKLLLKKKRDLKLQPAEYTLVLRIWFTCFSGLAYLKQFI